MILFLVVVLGLYQSLYKVTDATFLYLLMIICYVPADTAIIHTIIIIYNTIQTIIIVDSSFYTKRVDALFENNFTLKFANLIS